MSDDVRPFAADAPIYLDHNATTPIAPEVLDAMRPYLEDRFGNPSSAHRYGTVAHQAVERARAEVAALLGCEQDSIVFTASGSESDNLAIKGVALGLLGDGDHIITSAIEHPAVLDEIDRVLRPGGRLQLADVIIHHEVSEDARKRIDLWTG